MDLGCKNYVCEKLKACSEYDANYSLFKSSDSPRSYKYMDIAQMAFDQQYHHELVPGLSGGYRLGWIIGGCALLHACVAIGEASVRMTLPTPMKTLGQRVRIQQNDVPGDSRKRCPRSNHILS
jgi:hypothetical protein